MTSAAFARGVLHTQTRKATSVIEVQNVTKNYGTFQALEDVSFRIESGEIVGFLGPNGAGKTTSMRIITGYLAPSNGTVTVGGFDVVDQSLDARNIIGYLPETVPLYTEMSVCDYLNYMAKLRGISRNARSQRVTCVLEQCGLEERAYNIIGKLSKGYRQRVGIAQALVHDPPIVILDEPTIGLDPLQVVELRRLIKSLAGERTVVLSTHILPEVSMTCQRVLIMNRGRIVAENTPEGLARDLGQTDRVILRIKHPPQNAIEELENLDGVNRAEQIEDECGAYSIEASAAHDIRPELATHIVNEGWGLLEMKREDITLEDIFVDLITREEEVPA